MNLGMQLGQKMKMEQNLSPQMLQSIAILQMNTLDLETAVKQELETNPLLEQDDNSDERLQSIDSPTEEHTRKEGDDTSHELMETGEESNIDWDRYMSDGFQNTEAPLKDLNSPDPDDDDLRHEPTGSMSLQDFLKNQLREWKRPARIVAIVEYLIGCINEDGFLASAGTELSEIDPQKMSEKNPDILEAEEVLQKKKQLEEAALPVQEAFHVLQSFTPPGIGARDLRECLLIQAYHIPDFPLLSIQILEQQYDALKELRYAAIAKALNVTTEEVQKAVHELSRLTPHPGAQIDNTPSQTIVPDMEVVEVRPGEFDVVMKRGSMPHLHINETYRQLLKSSSASKADKDFVRNKLNSANMFIKSIDNRHSTMYLVMKAIVEKQHDFFAKGPENLKPMVLQDIANTVNRDPSTVNRATNGKYVETPFGVYELKQFFTSGVTQKDGSSMSSAKILDAIKELVENENSAAPLSDQAITETLAKQGISVARRTTAKYREELKILPARLRKSVK
ncbi:MAG: RNA polymerase factor sigma-54 [Fibrobacteraceae bacterium]|nr:RNA polymerase factor sigma-54 [Fibrobacteraceae bacterium]